jgi:hypothetical protein
MCMTNMIDEDALTNKELETIVLKINSMLINQGETVNNLLFAIEELKCGIEESKKSSSDIMEFLETVICPQLSGVGGKM